MYAPNQALRALREQVCASFWQWAENPLWRRVHYQDHLWFHHRGAVGGKGGKGEEGAKVTARSGLVCLLVFCTISISLHVLLALYVCISIYLYLSIPLSLYIFLYMCVYNFFPSFLVTNAGWARRPPPLTRAWGVTFSPFPRRERWPQGPSHSDRRDHSQGTSRSRRTLCLYKEMGEKETDNNMTLKKKCKRWTSHESMGNGQLWHLHGFLISFRASRNKRIYLKKIKN